MFVTLSEEQKRIAEAVQADGYAVSGIDALQVEDCYGAVRDLGLSFASSDRVKQRHEQFIRGEKQETLKQFIVKYQDVQSFDERHPLFRFGLLPTIHQTACACLGGLLTYYSADLWCVLPGSEGKAREWSQGWHRDPEADRLIKVFLFLEDVTDDSGPFEYVARSQRDGASRFHAVGQPRKYAGAEEVESVPSKDKRRFCVPAGCILFVDSSGLHRGGYTGNRRRLNCVFTYLPEGKPKFTLESIPLDLSEIQRASLCLN